MRLGALAEPLFLTALALAFLIPAALMLAVIGLPIVLVLGILAAPVLVVLFIVGLPDLLVRRSRACEWGGARTSCSVGILGVRLPARLRSARWRRPGVGSGNGT